MSKQLLKPIVYKTNLWGVFPSPTNDTFRFRSSELLMQYSSQNYLEVLTARQSLLQAELTAVNDRYDEIQGVINLYHALGGGY